MPDPIHSRAWRVLRDQVVAEEPLCWLRLPGCTTLSKTADHVLTRKERPDLAMVRANLRGACTSCNLKRNAKPARDVIAPKTRPAALSVFDH